MKKNVLFFWGLLLCSLTGFAQQNSNNKHSALGITKSFMKKLESQHLTAPYTIKLPVPGGAILTAKVNYAENGAGGLSDIQGEIQGCESGNFNISIDKQGHLTGNIILVKTKQAYRYYSNAGGNAFVEESDINKLICVSYAGVGATVVEEAALQMKPAIDPVVGDLQSLPGATGCLLLDFDGYEMPAGNLWNNGNAISAATSGMTDENIMVTWQIVAEDYIPFNVNVTTNEAVYNTYAQNKRMRCVVTPTDYFYPGAGGVAYISSFPWNNNVPCWVFTTGVTTLGKYVAEAASHEFGHTMGLSHDGTSTVGYYEGHGNWAPIMGVGYYKNVTQWSKGEYIGANNEEDDMMIISGAANGMGYRADDHTNISVTATPLINTGSVIAANANKGIIGNTGDTDRFSFTTFGGAATFNVTGTANNNGNIRLLVALYNSLNMPVNTYTAPAANLSDPVIVSETLAAGTYYITVTGTSDGTASTGYTHYASLGAYTISGTFNTIPLVVTMDGLKGTSVDAQHTLLHWNTFTENNNTGFEMYRSEDGKKFLKAGFIASGALQGNSALPLAYEFTDTAALPGISYYRLTQLDANGNNQYSNIVRITRNKNGNIKLDIFPNPVHTQLIVEVEGTFRENSGIMVTDMSGRVVFVQRVNAEKVIIDMAPFTPGMYLVRYADPVNTWVCKVLKN